MDATLRTLSDIEEHKAPTGGRLSRESGVGSSTVGDPLAGAPARACYHPLCRAEAEYYIPHGGPRAPRDGLALCTDCLEEFLERMKISIVLGSRGELCEWEQAILHLRNVFDDGRDYLDRLAWDSCRHRNCIKTVQLCPVSEGGESA